MTDIHYWIQLENRPWDASPFGRDRMMNQTIQEMNGVVPTLVTVPASPFAGSVARQVTMNNPIRLGSGQPVEALIFRRYQPPAQANGSDAWTVPDDRKVNPWDLNEPDPGEDGTRGTIPGPTIECDVGDTVFVHFRNGDTRVDYDVHGRTHSIHTHGFVFEATSDGAFPLSPPDQAQPVGAEATLWTAIGVTGPFKQGDRVPPGGTFTYTWQTVSWPTTAGIWLYHDHSVNDTENMGLGAIGVVVIHNRNDNQDVDVRLPTAADPTAPDPSLMPGGSAAGSPVVRQPFPIPFPIPARAADLAGLGGAHAPSNLAVDLGGGLVAELESDLSGVARLLISRYRTPAEGADPAAVPRGGRRGGLHQRPPVPGQHAHHRRRTG